MEERIGKREREREREMSSVHSRVRNCFCDQPRRDECISNFKITTQAGDHQFIKANTKYAAVALRGGGGPVLIADHSKSGRLSHDAPKVRIRNKTK